MASEVEQSLGYYIRLVRDNLLVHACPRHGFWCANCDAVKVVNFWSAPRRVQVTVLRLLAMRLEEVELYERRQSGDKVARYSENRDFMCND